MINTKIPGNIPIELKKIYVFRDSGYSVKVTLGEGFSLDEVSVKVYSGEVPLHISPEIGIQDRVAVVSYTKEQVQSLYNSSENYFWIGDECFFGWTLIPQFKMTPQMSERSSFSVNLQEGSAVVVELTSVEVVSELVTQVQQDAANVASDKQQVAADKAQVSADRVITQQEAGAAQDAADGAIAAKNEAVSARTAAQSAATATAADRVQTELDVIATNVSRDAAAASALEAARNGVSGKTATVSTIPVDGIEIYNVSQAGTYTNFSGIVVLPEDLIAPNGGTVTLRKEGIDWKKVITPNGTISKASVTPDKTTFFKPGKNLFNVNDPGNILGVYLNPDNGNQVVNTDFNTTHLIPVTPGQNVAVNTVSSQSTRFIWYRANGTYLSGQVGSWVYREVPADAAFVRLSIRISATPWATFTVENNTISTGHTPYEDVLDRTAKKALTADYATNAVNATHATTANTATSANNANTANNASVAAMANSLLGTFPLSKANLRLTDSKNIFNINSTVNRIGQYISSTGAVINDAQWNTTHRMPVSPGQQISISGNTQDTRVSWYNAAESWVSGVVGNNSTYTVPANIQFVTIGRSLNVTTWTDLVVEVAPSPTVGFRPYGTFIGSIDGMPIWTENLIVPQSATNPLLISLAPEYCVAIGRTIEIYNAQIAWSGNINDYHFMWSGVDKGKSLKRKWSLTGTVAGSHTLTLRVFDNHMNLVATATTIIRVVSNGIINPFTVCPIGDSLTNNKPWFAEITTLSGNKITSVGTRGGGKHEGRSGVTANYYLGNNSYTWDTSGIPGNDGRPQNLNPFFNPTTNKFDYAYYKSNYNQNPDKIIIWLGTNGISLNPFINARNIKAIVDGIRAVDADIPIFVVNTLYRSGQNGIGSQLNSDGYSASTAWKLEEDRKVFNLKVRVNELLAGLSKVYIVPVADCHDSEYNYGAVPTPPNPRMIQANLPVAAPGEVQQIAPLESFPVDSIHPQLPGYLQVADIIFSSLAANQ